MTLGCIIFNILDFLTVTHTDKQDFVTVDRVAHTNKERMSFAAHTYSLFSFSSSGRQCFVIHVMKDHWSMREINDNMHVGVR